MPAARLSVGPPASSRQHGESIRWSDQLYAAAQGFRVLGLAADADRARRLVAALRHRATRPWRVVVCSDRPVVGVSTTAFGVALALAALRDDPVAVVPSRPAPVLRALAEVVGADRRNGVPDVLDAPDLARADVLQGYQHIIVDVGIDAGPAAQWAVAGADHVVMVTDATTDAAHRVGAALDWQRRAGRAVRMADATVAVLDRTQRGYRAVRRGLRRDLGFRPDQCVLIPPDRHLAAGGPVHGAELGAATRRALLELAARTVTRTAGPP